MTSGRFTLDPGIKVFVSDLRMSWPRVLRRASLPGDLLSRGPAMLTTPRSTSGSGPRWSRRAATGTWPWTSGKSSSSRPSAPIVAALCSLDLTVAAHRIAAFKPLVGPLRLDIADTVDGLGIAYQWLSGQQPPALLATSELVFWVALARIATRHRVRPVQVIVTALPATQPGLRSSWGPVYAKARTPLPSPQTTPPGRS